MISGLEERVATITSTNPSWGLLLHRIKIGSSPLTAKTAMRIPQSRNHLFALADIVERTSEFMIALSMLLMTSNRVKPAIIRAASSIGAAPHIGECQAPANISMKRQYALVSARQRLIFMNVGHLFCCLHRCFYSC